MRLEKLTGFVVYAFPLGEADQIVTCITSAGNLQKFLAKGSRKVKSRFAASVQVFNLGEYIVYHGKGLPYLRQADIIDSFTPIRRDWSRSGAAFAVMELCRLLIGEEAGEKNCFQLVLEYMLHLKGNVYSSLSFEAFRLQFVSSLGYGMSFEHCTSCGQAVNNGHLVWGHGGVVCSRCHPLPQEGFRVNTHQLALLSTLQELDLLQASELDSTPAQRQTCAAAVDSLIFWLTEGKTKAQAFRRLFEDGF